MSSIFKVSLIEIVKNITPTSASLHQGFRPPADGALQAWDRACGKKEADLRDFLALSIAAAQSMRFLVLTFSLDNPGTEDLNNHSDNHSVSGPVARGFTPRWVLGNAGMILCWTRDHTGVSPTGDDWNIRGKTHANTYGRGTVAHDTGRLCNKNAGFSL